MKFGGDDRYYSHELKLEESFTVYFESKHDKLTKSLPKDCEERVFGAYKQWNDIIRNYLRNETGLKLAAGGERSAIKVIVDDGYPKPFVDLIDRFDDMLWELKCRKMHLELSLDELIHIRDNHAEIVKIMVKESKSSADDIDKTIIFVRDVLDVLINKKEKPIDDAIREINEDILGAYFIKKSTVRLFWKVIGHFARIIQVPIEDLTVVVLIHELAHAYSHVGLDIDGKHWNTAAFIDADMSVVEGIAQFYTWLISDKLQERAPGIIRAYENFLKLQKGSYTIHLKWIQSGGRDGEIIRHGLIHARRRSIKDLETFEKELEKGKAGLHPR